MDLGLDLIANPSKIKKRTYLVNKKEDFDLNEFIIDTVIDELNINTLNHPKSFIKSIVDFTLKVSREDKNVDISHLDDMKVENKKEDIKKLPLVLTKKKITLSSKVIEKKEPKIDVKKLSDLPTL
jgi:hypothetical protein